VTNREHKTIAPIAAPALVVSVSGALWLSADGEVEALTHEAASAQAISSGERGKPVLICHAPSLLARLGADRSVAILDVLELFAFVRPAAFCLPTVAGLAAALGLKAPTDATEAALTLQLAAAVLLSEAADDGNSHFGNRAAARRIAMTMSKDGWGWGPSLLAALGVAKSEADGRGHGLDAWTRLKPWEEPPPPAPAEDHAVGEDEARQRLDELLGGGGAAAGPTERREAQGDFAAAVANAFRPRDRAGAPNLVLAEAGTGVGKTLGYIAPAGLWAQRNGGAVWISTYTRNLQRQVDQELDRLYPDGGEKRKRVVVRKGRENYLCLLNLEEAVRQPGLRPGQSIALGLLARWVERTRDGDMVGGDFPAWLIQLIGRAASIDLSDHRGECVYAACPHYDRCFVENSRRRARYAEIVVANHALVMIRAALGEAALWGPTRYVLDEGHHLFDAADSAFAARLSGFEGAELRRWIRGHEAGRGRSRARGLEARIGDLLAELGDATQEDRLVEDARGALDDTARAAGALPGPGWLGRLREEAPSGEAETFLSFINRQVMARVENPDSDYGLECGVDDPVPGLVAAGEDLQRVLARLARGLRALAQHLQTGLEDEAAELDSGQRIRIEGAIRGLVRRRDTVTAWQGMIAGIGNETPAAFVDWFAVDRRGGRIRDVGFHRHFVDPTEPLAETLLAQAHGVAITSATLRDEARDDGDESWSAAEIRTGALHLPLPPRRASLPSPFDYAGKTRIYVVNDVNRNNAGAVASAYRELFKAAGGGALGLFTAIVRLRSVHEKIAGPLEEAGLRLLAQHVDMMDTGTLVDIFRAEEDTCLLGTDAVRDGIDVPGRSLRLIVFDRVPWPRPDILHRARRKAFGGSAYDDMLVRFRLKQAYGRLLRRADDKGVFVMLDAMLPSRLARAFPEEVEIVRTGLADVIAGVSEFLNSTSR
jgi:ATP-dependent DNA helicase DinG